MLFRLKIAHLIQKWSLWDQNLIMGVYDVMGAKFLNKKGLKIKKFPKNAQIWSVKYTKFDNFSKKHVSMVDRMCRHYFKSSFTFQSISLSFCAVLLLLGYIFIILSFF